MKALKLKTKKLILRSGSKLPNRIPVINEIKMKKVNGLRGLITGFTSSHLEFNYRVC